MPVMRFTRITASRFSINYNLIFARAHMTVVCSVPVESSISDLTLSELLGAVRSRPYSCTTEYCIDRTGVNPSNLYPRVTSRLHALTGVGASFTSGIRSQFHGSLTSSMVHRSGSRSPDEMSRHKWSGRRSNRQDKAASIVLMPEWRSPDSHTDQQLPCI